MAIDIRVLGEQPSLLGQLLAEIRDLTLQQDRMRFRRNLERLGEMFAYEISKELDYVSGEVTTPLGIAQTRVLGEQPVLAAILRAGLPLHQGLLNYFDAATNAFISARRKHHGDADSFEIEIGYLASPPLDGKVLILCDPMLATGSSMVLAYKALLKEGVPRKLHAVALVACEQGIEFARQHLPANTTLWLGAVDPGLNPRAYIVPGLGDAGDLAFGIKQ